MHDLPAGLDGALMAAVAERALLVAEPYVVLEERLLAAEAEATRHAAELESLLADSRRIRADIDTHLGRTDLDESEFLSIEAQLRTRAADVEAHLAPLRDAVKRDAAIVAARRAKAADALAAHRAAKAAELRPQYLALRERQVEALGAFLSLVREQEEQFFSVAERELHGSPYDEGFERFRASARMSASVVPALQTGLDEVVSAQIPFPRIRFKTRADLGFEGGGWSLDPASLIDDPKAKGRR